MSVIRHVPFVHSSSRTIYDLLPALHVHAGHVDGKIPPPLHNLPLRIHHHHHHHHHFICPIIQQYAHLHQYNLEERDSKGPTRTLTAALKRSV